MLRFYLGWIAFDYAERWRTFIFTHVSNIFFITVIGLVVNLCESCGVCIKVTTKISSGDLSGTSSYNFRDTFNLGGCTKWQSLDANASPSRHLGLVEKLHVHLVHRNKISRHICQE